MNGWADGRLLLIILAMMLATPAESNDFALNEGAFGPVPLDVKPGHEAPLRLVEERLVFHFGRESTRVHATFVFENPSPSRTVRQLSGFPDIRLGGDDDPWERGLWNGTIPNSTGPLEQMVTRINGRQVASAVRLGYVRATNSSPWLWLAADSINGRRVGWHLVELRLPPRGRLTLERDYLTSNGNESRPGGIFTYITLTGGPWQGPIGRLRAEVVLEDDLTMRDLDWLLFGTSMDMGTYPDVGEWVQDGLTRLHLEWTNFEPMTDERRQLIRLVWRE